jgi:hypothetical protein
MGSVYNKNKVNNGNEGGKWLKSGEEVETVRKIERIKLFLTGNVVLDLWEVEMLVIQKNKDANAPKENTYIIIPFLLENKIKIL